MSPSKTINLLINFYYHPYKPNISQSGTPLHSERDKCRQPSLHLLEKLLDRRPNSKSI